jgi:hypothetical protein
MRQMILLQSLAVIAGIEASVLLLMNAACECAEIQSLL